MGRASAYEDRRERAKVRPKRTFRAIERRHEYGADVIHVRHRRTCPDKVAELVEQCMAVVIR